MTERGNEGWRELENGGRIGGEREGNRGKNGVAEESASGTRVKLLTDGWILDLALV